MPLPEKPSDLTLECLSASVGEPLPKGLDDELMKEAREWMQKSFPGAKIFENRVYSLWHLLTRNAKRAIAMASATPAPQVGTSAQAKAPKPKSKDDTPLE